MRGSLSFEEIGDRAANEQPFQIRIEEPFDDVDTAPSLSLRAHSDREAELLRHPFIL
jgi:hypothetical protein